MTVRELMVCLKAQLSDNPEQEALWLCAHAAGVKPSGLLARAGCDAPYADRALELARRRMLGEPLQYLLGTQPFMDFDVLTDKRALIPRADTETLARAALDIIRTKHLCNPDILELCTGTGAIAIALLRGADTVVTATDISGECIALARENADWLGVGHRLRLAQGDLFDAVDAGARYDIVLANPPYVRTSDIAGLAREVRDWEPRKALDGGEDGLEFYRRIAAEAVNFIKPGGSLLLEVGAGQARDVASMLCGATYVDILKDDNGIERVVVANNYEVH